jgi:pyruvate formate lyase activating enzyme
MSQTLTGSRYEIHVARKGAHESKAARDYFAIHPGDIEEVKEGDDVIGYVHSVEVGSTVDGPGIRFVGFLTGCLLRCADSSAIRSRTRPSSATSRSGSAWRSVCW